MSENKQINNLAFLNIIRFLLAISITLWHDVGCQFGFKIGDYGFLRIFKNLTICGGNQVFFLISGMMFFLVYYPLLNENKTTPKQFLLSRTIKIVPITTISTLIAFFATFLLNKSVNFMNLIIDLVFFGNTILRGGYGFYNGPIWYLAVLFVCYFVSIIVFLCSKRNKSIAWYLIPLFLGLYLCYFDGTNTKYIQIGMGLYNYF